MRLLVTRPQNGAERFARALRANGHEPVVAPLTVVRFRDGAQLTLDGVQAVLATSANGVRALARRTSRRDIALLAVGAQTAQTALNADFIAVTDAGGDATALVELAAATLDPAKGMLFHASGADTVGRVNERLEARGFTIATEILYDAESMPSLPQAAAKGLLTDTLDGVFFFSPRTAEIFSRLVVAAALGNRCARLTAYCISAATVDALLPLRFARTAVATSPNQAAMLALVVAANPVA